MEKRKGIDLVTQQFVQEHYSHSYVTEKEDSPDASRVSLRRRLREVSGYLLADDNVLDLGAGRQIFEREYRQVYTAENFNFVTLDFANIKNKKLLGKKGDSHVRAAGDKLPFADETFAAVVSSMALDFMPTGAISEMVRVMRPGGRAFVNLHHRDLIKSNLNVLASRRKLGKKAAEVQEFFEHLAANEVLYKNAEDIKNSFESAGLKVIDVKLQNDSSDKWWEVDLVKKPNITWISGNDGILGLRGNTTWLSEDVTQGVSISRVWDIEKEPIEASDIDMAFPSGTKQFVLYESDKITTDRQSVDMYSEGCPNGD